MPDAATGDLVQGDTWRDAQRQAAAAVHGLVSGAYGPHGGAQLVGRDGRFTWLESGAGTLREAAAGPLVEPYRRLAFSVWQAVGDQATGAVLLASGLVGRVLDAVPPGRGPGRLIDGLAQARRQASAVLASLAVPDSEGRCLEGMAPAHWRAPVLAGLAGMGDHIDLDTVEIVVRDVPLPAWRPWTACPVRAPALGMNGRLLLLARAPQWRPRTDVTWRLSLGGPDASAAEEARIRAWVAGVWAAGVVAVVCGQSLGAAGDVLRAQGALVWEDASAGARRRLAAGCGAVELLDGRLEEEGWAAALGRVRVARDGEGAWLQGDGQAWTLVLPGTGVRRQAVAEQGERLLRAVGAWLEDPRAVPGGGGWQRAVASALRRAADGLPDHMPLAWRAAASAVEDLPTALAVNAGLDPLDPSPGTDVLDAYACVRHAVDAAFTCALQVLATAGMHRKPPSDPAALRGGTGPAGSPLGLPGDIPPLM